MIDLDLTINLSQFMIYDRCVFVGYGMLAYLGCHINLYYLISLPQTQIGWRFVSLTSVCCVWSRLLLLSISSKNTARVLVL